jgi:Zinc-binding dehydrogenase
VTTESLGASEVFDYHAVGWAQQVRAAVPGGVDLLLDGAGGQTRDQALGAVRDGGRAIFLVLQSTPAQLERGITGESSAAHADRPRLEQLGRPVDAGQLRRQVGAVLPLEQVREALARVAGRRHRPAGIRAPGQVRTRRAQLLTRIPLTPPSPLRRPGRRGPSGPVLQRRRQRGIAGIPRCGTLQLRQPLLQFADPPGQRRVLHRQHGDELALQRDQRITGSIQRPGSHRPPSSGQANGNQDNTLGRPPGIITGGNPDTH